MIQLPIIGALLEAVGTIFEKKILNNRYINYKNYTVYEFFSIIIVMSTFVFFFWKLEPEALSLMNILIFMFVVVVAIIANLLIFHSLKREDVSEFEPLWLTQPLFVIVLAFILYPVERNWIVFGLAMVASISLVLSHVKKKHLEFDKYTITALLGSFLFAVELIASKPILDYYSPFSFYFLRCLFVFIIVLFIFRPSFRKVGGKNWAMIFLVGLIWALYRAITYYGYQHLGIIFTTILFILSPVFLFFFAIVFLKEKPTKRQIISTIIIVICVALAVFFQY